MKGLIADIGGTNARFALADTNGKVQQVKHFPCRDFPRLADACEAYLTELAATETDFVRPRAAAIAVASPVDSDDVRMTNHVWSFSIEETRRQLQFDTLQVINDFVAVALGLPHLTDDDVLQVGSGIPVARQPMAVLGAGTGLGVSAMLPTGLGWAPLSSEGGHVTAPAVNEREAAVLAVLRGHFGHVSAERIISGPGLVNLSRAIAELDGVGIDPDLTPADCTSRALDQSCHVSTEALNMFAAILGTVAANLAVTLCSRGGVYIAGGIVPRLGDWFLTSPFRQRFEDKGRFGGYLAAIPTYVVTNSHPAFVGLASLVTGRGR
ncbi:glucokinase [Defluviicoccus vanus]|uniref:Glucokinase n=1 Tax=Defluviicoccus vanus TaxID=111831 RepID=A0A7H1N0I0_9PROT|nr:glucokinase [Defluviicoccus vanus]QNT69216.1 glucokinase [Defluviicoccus vanus]